MKVFVIFPLAALYVKITNRLQVIHLRDVKLNSMKSSQQGEFAMSGLSGVPKDISSQIERVFGQPLPTNLDTESAKKLCRLATITATALVVVSTPWIFVASALIGLVCTQQLKGYRETMNDLVNSGSTLHRCTGAYATLLSAWMFSNTSAVLLGLKLGAEFGQQMHTTG